MVSCPSRNVMYKARTIWLQTIQKKIQPKQRNPGGTKMIQVAIMKDHLAGCICKDCHDGRILLEHLIIDEK